MFRKILAANDGSENAFKAVRLAAELATRTGAELHMIIVEEIPELAETVGEVHQAKTSEDKRVKAYVSRAETIASRLNVPLNAHVFTGHVVRSVVDFANDNRFDLLVIGATGHAPLHERMLGTRADRIAHLARCPVLIAK